MKQLLVITAAMCFAACTTQPTTQEPAARNSLPEPVKLVQYDGVGFAFCSKDCPSATEKVIFMSLDLSSSDAKERVLARLRAQMLRQSGKPPRAEKTGTIVEVERAQGTGTAGDAWTIYALLGDARQPATKSELSKIVSAAPGAKFHLLASEAAQADVQSYRSALAQLGVPQGEIGTFVLQAPMRSDLVIAGTSAAASAPSPESIGAGRRLLVIRELARN